MVKGAGTRILAVFLLCLQGSRISSALRLGVYHSIKEDTGPGWHDLKAVAEALNHTGYQVGISHQILFIARHHVRQNSQDPSSIAGRGVWLH